MSVNIQVEDINSARFLCKTSEDTANAVLQAMESELQRQSNKSSKRRVILWTFETPYEAVYKFLPSKKNLRFLSMIDWVPQRNSEVKK